MGLLPTGGLRGWADGFYEVGCAKLSVCASRAIGGPYGWFGGATQLAPRGCRMTEHPSSKWSVPRLHKQKPIPGWLPIVLLGLVLALLITIVGGYALHWPWTGYGEENQDSLWDWLKLVLFPTTLLLLPFWLRSRERQRVWWRVGFAILAVVFAVLVVGGYWLGWTWTGFSDNKLWNWLDLFLMPFALPVVILWATTPPDSIEQPDPWRSPDQPEPGTRQAAELIRGPLPSPSAGSAAGSSTPTSAMVDLVQLLRHPDPAVRLASRQLLESLSDQGRDLPPEAGIGQGGDGPSIGPQADRDRPRAEEEAVRPPAVAGPSRQPPGFPANDQASLAAAVPLRGHPALMIIIAAVAAGLLIAGTVVLVSGTRTPARNVAGSPQVTGSASALARVVEVPSTRRWIRTGVYLLPGDRVTISGTGEVYYDISRPRPPVGPDGDSQSNLAKYSILKSANHAALIGEIKSNTPGRPFLVGSYYHIDSHKRGLLLLGVNDTYVKDNRGKFIARIEVSKP